MPRRCDDARVITPAAAAPRDVARHMRGAIERCACMMRRAMMMRRDMQEDAARKSEQKRAMSAMIKMSRAREFILTIYLSHFAIFAFSCKDEKRQKMACAR